jgi:hypothetical protein
MQGKSFRLTSSTRFRENAVSRYYRPEDRNRVFRLVSYRGLYSVQVKRICTADCQHGMGSDIQRRSIWVASGYSHSKFCHTMHVSPEHNLNASPTSCHWTGRSTDSRVPVLTKMFYRTNSKSLTWKGNSNSLTFSCFLSESPFDSTGNGLLRIYYEKTP